MLPRLLLLLGVLLAISALAWGWSRFSERALQTEVDRLLGSEQQVLSQFRDSLRTLTGTMTGSSLFASSIGRYYGFGPAFSQISPDPEQAAHLLRSTYPPPDQGSTDLPPALIPYDTVHLRFHSEFQRLLANTPIDDVLLINRQGRILYTYRKDSLFAADLQSAALRDTPLARAFRDVVAGSTHAPSDQLVTLTTHLRGRTEAVTALARPIIRHGVLEGVSVFLVPETALQAILADAPITGLTPVLSLSGPPAPSGTARLSSPVVTIPETPWQLRIDADYQAVPLSGAVAAPVLVLTLAALGGGLMLGLLWAVQSPTSAARPTVTAPSLSHSPHPILMTALSVHQAATQETPGHLTPAHLTPAEPSTPAPPIGQEGQEGDSSGPDDTGFEESPPPPESLAGADAGETVDYRRAIVDVMIATLDYWQTDTGKGKIELAEESGLWRVYMDRSSLQTRTLDKYLLMETLPRNPRWRDVIRTGEFVLRRCETPGRDRDTLITTLSTLKTLVRDGERSVA